MAKLAAIVLVALTFLLIAPVIESGTSSPVPVFQAVGNAEDSAGGGW
jgi:hypothetical protein